MEVDIVQIGTSGYWANRFGGIMVTGSRALDNLNSTPSGEFFDSPYLVWHHLSKPRAFQQA